MEIALKAIAAATLCVALASTTSNARSPYGCINVGNWHGGAYTDDKNGSLSHCAPPPSAPPNPGKTIKQTGAGFVISANGHVATNQHVIEGCAGDIQGNLSGESPIKLRVDHSHRDRTEHDREKIRQLTQHCPPS
jgi:S1-C subfamily serine protease